MGVCESDPRKQLRPPTNRRNQSERWIRSCKPPALDSYCICNKEDEFPQKFGTNDCSKCSTAEKSQRVLSVKNAAVARPGRSIARRAGA